MLARGRGGVGRVVGGQGEPICWGHDGVCRRVLLCQREARAEKSQGNTGSQEPEGRAPRRPCARERPSEGLRLRGRWAHGRLRGPCSILKIWPVPQGWATRGSDSHPAYGKILLGRKQQEQMVAPETSQGRRPC